jgi:2,3-bisphosphoglycerate-dependent phosphoglycerate mutase
MELYLVRHSQSLNNALPQTQRVDDPGLTELGHLQAEHLAQSLAPFDLTKIYSSPFLRTLETSEHLWRATGLRPEVRVELHEKGGCVSGVSPETMQGRPGMTRQQMADRFPEYLIPPDIDGQGWWQCQPYEPLSAARDRATNLYLNLCRENRANNDRIVLVMHGDIELLFLACFHNGPLDLPPNASLTKIVVNNGDMTLVDFANVQHLPEALRTG